MRATLLFLLTHATALADISAADPAKPATAGLFGTVVWAGPHHPERTTRVATVPPGGSLPVSTKVRLRFYAGDKLLRTLEPGEDHVVLPEGTIQVLDDQRVAGWVYVTPYPVDVLKHAKVMPIRLLIFRRR